MKILKFGAVWCSGCLVMNPRLEAIEKELPDLETIYFDYDTDIKEVRKWDVSDMLPTFILVDKNDNEIIRFRGEKSKEYIMNLIKENIDK
ncbi:MAG: thioredoxin family protein [Bacilli bacterium]|nr:thioredoxin family protein [Bacilli bacterium]